MEGALYDFRDLTPFIFIDLNPKRNPWSGT